MQKQKNRNIWRKISTITVALLLALMLASCGTKLSGTYSTSGSSVTFSGDQITVNILFIVATGKYTIKGDQIYITWDDESYDEESFDFEIVDKETIIFDGTELKKRK